jgi:diphosphomevalonate decarboxylase
LGALVAVSERSCLAMHADMLASRPALIYWNGATLECIHAIRELREREGVEAFFTVDAGPQVKAVCTPAAASRVAAVLGGVAGVQEVLVSGLGAGARLLAGTEPTA